MFFINLQLLNEDCLAPLTRFPMLSPRFNATDEPVCYLAFWDIFGHFALSSIPVTIRSFIYFTFILFCFICDILISFHHCRGKFIFPSILSCFSLFLFCFSVLACFDFLSRLFPPSIANSMIHRFPRSLSITPSGI